jgi:uncharacterized protein (DUF362 family)
MRPGDLIRREAKEQKGILSLLDRLNVKVMDFDQLAAKEWVLCKPKESNWAVGFCVARSILESECLVYTRCLKTDAPLGVYAMAMKHAIEVRRVGSQQTLVAHSVALSEDGVEHENGQKEFFPHNGSGCSRFANCRHGSDSRSSREKRYQNWRPSYEDDH